MSKSVLFAALLGASLFTFSSLTIASAQDSIAAQVEKAQTQADHEAVAKKFEEEADALDKQAVEHEKLAARYRKQPNPWGPKSGTSSVGLAKHCDRLAEGFKKSAVEAREMARLHRDVGALLAK